MNEYFKIVLEYFKGICGYAEENYTPIDNIIPGMEFLKSINAGTFSVPNVVLEEGGYSVNLTRQNELDYKNEVMTDVGFTIMVVSEDIDEIIEKEEAIAKNLNSGVNLSEFSQESSVKYARLLPDPEKKIARYNNKIGTKSVYRTVINFKCTDILLPKRIAHPIKVELDKQLQHRLMKHLDLLDDTAVAIQEQIRESMKQYSDELDRQLEQVTSAEQLAELQEQATLQIARWEGQVEGQLKDLAAQADEMYTFGDLCPEKISIYNHGFKWCYDTMIREECDLQKVAEAFKAKVDQERAAEEAEKQRIAEEEAEKQRKIEEEKRQEEERINRIRRQFGKQGDPALNRYTDVVVEDVKKKLKLDTPFSVYGGSTFMEYYRKLEEGTLEFPVILISDYVSFNAERKNYANHKIVNGQTVDSPHNYSLTALPIAYGLTFDIVTKTNDGHAYKHAYDISKQLTELYKDQIIYFPDPQYPDEQHPFKFSVADDKSEKEIFIGFNDDNAYDWDDMGVSRVVFLRYLGAYYVQEHNREELVDNQRLQLRMVQLAQLWRYCRALGVRAGYLIKTKYKPLADKKPKMFGLFDSGDYQKLMNSFRYGTEIDRSLFEKEFKEVISVYPFLYDKVKQGWTYDQILADVEKNAEIFKQKADSLCDLLGVESVLYGDNEALTFYINQMFHNPYCSIDIAVERYNEKLEEKWAREREEAEARAEARARRAEQEEYERDSSGSSGGSFFGNMARTAADKTSKKKESRYKDLIGSPGCIKGKKNAHGFTLSCYFACPLWQDCSRGEGRGRS